MIRVLACLLFAFPSIASAALMTMSFDQTIGIPLPDATPYVEDGITATGRVAWWMTPGAAYVAQGGVAPFGGPLDFQTGGLFTPVSVMVDPIRSGYCVPSCESEIQSVDGAVPYIWVSGFLEDLLVGEKGFYMPSEESWSTLALDFLGQIDLLRIRATYAGGPVDGEGRLLCLHGCGEFNIDNLQVHSVPEPETILLLAFGALSAWMVRRRRVV